MKTIWKYLKQYKKECFYAPLFKMLEALFELYVPLVISDIIDVGISGQNSTYIIQRCMILILLAVVGLSCSVTAQYFAAKAGVGCATNMRRSLFKHIQGLSFTEQDTLGTSTLITRMTSDINQVQNGVNLVLRLFLRSPFIVFGAMIMAFTIDVKAALIFVVTIPLLSIVVFGIMLFTRPMYRKVQQGLDSILGITRENIKGVRVIRAFNKEADEIQHFEDENQNLYTTQKLVGKISGLMNPLTYLIVNVAIITLIWTGALRVESGTLTQGQVIALYNYMSQILVELIKLANLIVSISKALACAKRIENVFDIESGMTDGSLDKNNIQSISQYDPAVAVEFKDVELTYKGASVPSLSEMNFKVLKGQTIGIIGGTGSGKTSLVHMIPRFYDATNGEVLINGINVKDYKLSELRSKIAIVMQKTLLFQGSIKENIAWGNKSASDSDFEMALEISQSKEIVEKKDKKLDEYVEQGGRNLSGGQRQRLSIARAVIKKPEILILDDSSSALDYATDAALRKALRTLPENTTVFIVSQRAASLMHADQIIVLDDGQITGIGTHAELLNTCDTYKEIYNSQFKESEAK